VRPFVVALPLLIAAMGCGTKDDTPEVGSLDSGVGVPDSVYPDLSLDPNGCLPGFYPHLLDVAPSTAITQIDTATSPPTPGTVVFTARIDCEGPGVDVSAEAAFSLADPPLGTFESNVFTSKTSLPDVTGLGAATTMVHATARGFSGTATVTVVELRASGEHRDLFFQIPYLNPAAPVHQVLVANVSSSDDVTTRIASDPHNPTGPDGKPYDATAFLAPIRAMDEGSVKDGCAGHAAKDTDADGVLDAFAGPIDGRLCFQVTPNLNRMIAIKPLPTTLVDSIVLETSPSGSALDLRSVILIVPANGTGF